METGGWAGYAEYDLSLIHICTVNDLKKVGTIMTALALIMMGAAGCTNTSSSSGDSSDISVGITADGTEVITTPESSDSPTQEPTEYIPPENIEGSIEIPTYSASAWCHTEIRM